jgi:hypothetical protein
MPGMQATRFQVFALGILLGSASGACLARILVGPALAIWIAAPAIFILGTAVYGHVITFDDDFPGGWSNQDGSWRFFRRSLYELLGKAVCLALILAVILV